MTVSSIDTISQTICKRHENIGYEDSLEKPPPNTFRCLAPEITKKCNLNCIHCYLSAGKTHKNELTLKEIKELLQAAVEAGGISVSLGGGEPLVRDDCTEIIQYAPSLDLLITLGTNGALIDEKIAKKLSGIPMKIQISLDGAGKETHDSIRGAGSFNSTVKGIDHLVHEGMAKDIVIAFTPMKANVDDIPGIIDFALERQIPVIQFPPLSSSGRAKKRWNELRLSNQQMLRFWEFVAKKSGELKGTMDLLADCFSISINNPGVPHRCTIGTQIRVDPQGDVYPCQCFHYGSRYCLGNIREKSLKDIVNGQRIEEIKKTCFQRPFNIEECRNCKWRNYGCHSVVRLASTNNQRLMTVLQNSPPHFHAEILSL